MGYILLCVLVADFLTGLVHWLEDTYAVPSWPFLGKEIALPNIEHHRNPNLLGSMTSFVWRNYQAIIPSIVGSVVAFHYGGEIGPYLVLIFFLAALGNEVHVWSHRKNNIWPIRFLQEACILQHPRQHLKHHKRPYTAYYCTLTNFTNEVLETIRFWRGLEWIVLKVFRVTPKRLSPERDGF